MTTREMLIILNLIKVNKFDQLLLGWGWTHKPDYEERLSCGPK
jgi:hypothetical protein